MNTRKSPIFLSVLLVGTLCLAAPPALAWGRTGHKVVCLLAYEALTDETRAKVDALIALDPEFPHFTDSCNWADSPRKRPSDHYMNIARATRPGEIADCGDADKCVLSAIEEDYRILADNAAPPERRLIALKFLGHWVGDIHQPLHVSFADDRGGNDIKTRGLCRGTLHGAWDGCIIARAVGEDAAAIAAFVRKKAAAASEFRSDAPRQWANESYAIALASSTGYCFQTDETCDYSNAQKIYEEGAAKRVEEIGQAYIDRNKGAAEKQLARAGARLGALINAALSD